MEPENNQPSQMTNLQIVQKAASEAHVELPEGRLEVLFHGTTEDNARQIIQSEGEALRTSPNQPPLYVTHSYNTAWHFAQRTAERQGAEPAVVGMALTESDFERVATAGKTVSHPIEDRPGMNETALSPAAVEKLKQQDAFYFSADNHAAQLKAQPATYQQKIEAFHQEKASPTLNVSAQLAPQPATYQQKIEAFNQETTSPTLNNPPSPTISSPNGPKLNY
jgi:hypothetical protein